MPAPYGLSSLLGRELAHRVDQQRHVERDLDGYRDPMIGFVTENQDPQKLGRVKVKITVQGENFTTDWVQMIVAGAGPNRGWFFIPEAGDEVLVMFRDGEPLIVGALWGKDKPPDTNPDGDNARRVIKSRAGSRVVLDDVGDTIIIEDGAGKGRITFDAASNKITIEALDGDVCFQAPKGEMKITAQSAELKATKNIELRSGGTMKWTAQAAVTITGGKVDLSGMTGANLSCGNAQSGPPSQPGTPTKIPDPVGS